MPIYYLTVPVLSMLMDFLWLAYRKYEYKYTMIRWTMAYYIIRLDKSIICSFHFQASFYFLIARK